MSPITFDDLEKNFSLLRKSPEKYLELANEFVKNNPDHAGGYFRRHFAWENLGHVELALQDLRTAHKLDPKNVDYYALGRVLHSARRFSEAIGFLNFAEQGDPSWRQGPGPLYRADCYARLGNETAALADCACLNDDHFLPYSLFDLPKGDKQQVIAEIRRRAVEARQANR